MGERERKLGVLFTSLEPPDNMDNKVYLLHQYGEALVLEGLGELNVLSTLVVDGERRYDHVGKTAQQLSHHAIPLLLITVIYLEEHTVQHEWKG